MIELIQIELPVDSDARSSVGRPYLDHEDFIKYCNANGVNTNAEALEAYEKRSLLHPCIRLLFPTELLKRRFRADLANADSYRGRDEWEPLINLEKAVPLSQMRPCEEFKKAMTKGHPLECALAAGMPFIVNPSEEKYRAWGRYLVVEGSYMGMRSKKSRAIHYYSSWKIFLLDELNKTNTVCRNLATGQVSRYRLWKDELHTCSLNEFIPYFKNIATFSYRNNLREINYHENAGQTKAEFIYGSQRLAKALIKDGYKKWIRFLRKLIELHENYRNALHLIIAEETKHYIARTVRMIGFATGHDFKRICDDVSGPLINSLDVGREDGVHIYPRMLEEILATAKWDLRRNVKRHFTRALDDFNKLLIEKEKIPKSLCEELFEELIREPEEPVLIAIRKIDMALNREKLYRNAEMWSGNRDLATSLEVHGRGWSMDGNTLGQILTRRFKQYSDFKNSMEKNKGSSCAKAVDSDEFLDKLKKLSDAKHIPSNKRIGRHLLIAHLSRNYAVHQKGLTGKSLRENLGQIYNALMSTLFVFYAAYKRQ